MTFRSIHHPGDVSRAWLTVQAQAQPVAMALLAVMTVGLAAALQGRNILWPFVTGAAIAYVVAAAVGQNKVLTTPAQVEVFESSAAVQSMWQAASEPIQPVPAFVSSARLTHGELTVGIGDSVESFHRADWPDFDALVQAFRRAAEAGQAASVMV